MTLLANGSFENGWTDEVIHGRVCQRPNGWTLAVLPQGELLHSTGGLSDIDHEPILTEVGTIPEIIHKHTGQLPPDQQPGAEDALILDGEYVYKIFSNYSPYSVTLSQALELEPGTEIAFTVPVRVHYNPYPGGDGSPGACAFRTRIVAGLTRISSDWLTFDCGLTDREWATVTLYASAPNGGEIVVGAQFESRSEAGIDFFTDAWSVTVVNPPEPPGCPGAPREDYVRVYNVIPQDATDERAAEIAAIAWERGKQTAGGSYDDAGIGDLSDKTAVLWDIPIADRAEFEAFFAEHYPLALVEFDGEGDEQPPPPPPSEEPQYELSTSNLIGLHMQEPKQSWPVYVAEAQPAVYKTVNQLGMIVEAKQAYPDMLTVYRFHVHNDGAWLDKPDLAMAAEQFLDLYTANFDSHAANTGMTVEQVLSYVDVIESINEVVGSNYERNQRAVAFDCHFADAVRARYGALVDAGILTVAIGNPPEDQVSVLLPAARKAYEDGHFLAYHAYWTANRLRPEPPYLIRHWDYHAGRWQRWDDLFRSHSIYPRYYLGEGGIVFARDEGGIDFSSGQGWRSCGSFDYYISQLDLMNQALLAWNDEHGNRCRGLTVFCYGGQGWTDFDFEPGDLYALRDWALTL